MVRIALSVVLLAVAWPASAIEPAVIGVGDRAALSGHIETLRDPDGRWTIDDVLTPAVAGRFEPSPDVAFNRGLTEDAWWYRFAVRTASAAPVDAVLSIGLQALDYVDVHVVRPGAPVRSVLTGDQRHQQPELLHDTSFSLPLTIESGVDTQVYVRVRTIGRHQFWPILYTTQGFASDAQFFNRMDGLVDGITLLMLLYNLIVYVAIRDRATLWFVLLLASYMAASFIQTGVARICCSDLAENAPALFSASVLLGNIVVIILSVLFAREFLETRRQAPRAHRLLTACAVLAAALVLSYPLLGFLWVTRITSPLIVVTFFSLFVAAVNLSMQGVRSARFYLLAMGVNGLAVLYQVFTTYGGPTMNAFAGYAPSLTLMLGGLVLSAGLADRMRIERREQQAAAARISRLKGFLPQRVADLVAGDGDVALLAPKRRQVTVCVIDLRGFTPFAETSAPEDVMAVLREFYEAMGAIVEKHGGTVEHFAGDSMLIFFNAPLEIANPEEHAVRTALEMQAAFTPLRDKWLKNGHELGLGIGIASGYATTGAIGFSGRSQYAAIGAVTNLASRLCSAAQHGEILTTARVHAVIESMVEAQPAGEQAIRGFSRPVQVLRILALLHSAQAASRTVAVAMP